MNSLMFKLVLQKAEEPEIKLPTSTGSSKKKTEFQKNIYLHFIDYAKAFDSVDHNKLWKILKDMGIPNHLTCLLRWVCPCEGQMWRWCSCLGHRGSGSSRYSEELAARAAGNTVL